MTALTIIQNACDQIQGLSRPVAAASNSDPGMQQMFRLLNMGGRVLAGDYDWSALCVTRNFVALATQPQIGEPPDDFDRFVSRGQIIDTNSDRVISGARNQNDFFKLTNINLGATTRYWCMINGVINITPAPTTLDDFGYVYVTKNWVRPNGGSTDRSQDLPAFVADDDSSLLDEELHTLDLIWRWKHAKGMEYAEDQSNFERAKESQTARDRGPSEIMTARIYDSLPDNVWPDVIG